MFRRRKKRDCTDRGVKERGRAEVKSGFEIRSEKQKEIERQRASWGSVEGRGKRWDERRGKGGLREGREARMGNRFVTSSAGAGLTTFSV